MTLGLSPFYNTLAFELSLSGGFTPCRHLRPLIQNLNQYIVYHQCLYYELHYTLSAVAKIIDKGISISMLRCSTDVVQYPDNTCIGVSFRDTIIVN